MDAIGMNEIQMTDPEIARAISDEFDRQLWTLEMIASENIASPAVMATQGSVMTNKYAEGYPSKRYYGGCEHVDVAEKLAIARAKEIFKAEYVNVQPHSGSQANMAVYFALLQTRETILGMDLAHGGHLTHGSPVSFSGKLFNFVHYGVKKESGIIDYESVARLARQHRPKLIVAGASAYPRIIEFDRFAQIARSVGAFLMVDMAHIAGLVAADVHPSPIPFSDVVTSTTHKTLRGPRGGLILSGSEHAKALGSQIFPGIQGGPLMHVIAAKAVAFQEVLQGSFKTYQENVVDNARTLADRLMSEGVQLVSNGTDNHMVLADLTNIGLTGREAEQLLGKAGITVNKNAIPFDPLSRQVTSGIRIGTPAVTTRGMGKSEMETIAELMVNVLKNPGDEKNLIQTREKVKALCAGFPLYGGGGGPA